MATSTTTATLLGTSNLRGSSSRTRNLPARTSRNARGTLRQNSLLSIPTSAPSQALLASAAVPIHEGESHGFYPAISHFTDAITALPRDFRRHTSLLKEVDAKAWTLEENIQKLLQQCLLERQSRPLQPSSTSNTAAGSVSSVAGDATAASTAGSVLGVALDTASQYPHAAADQDVLHRRRLYAELRSNLMQMIMPLDEKNHVINNANEELSKHIRRQDEIWPSIADEISEETRLGNLTHWALVDLNPPKKLQPVGTRGRDTALLPDNEVAERSERRREAMALAKKQKTAVTASHSTALAALPLMAVASTHQLDSDLDNQLPTSAPVRKPARKATSAKRPQEIDGTLPVIPAAPTTALTATKPAKPRTNAAKRLNEVSTNAATTSTTTTAPSRPSTAIRAVPMSRENSQQENAKKRKAAAPAAAPARKRLNATTHDSPKLANSPLAATFGNEVYKRSPALQSVRPVNGRVRQNSAQSTEPVNRPASAASKRNTVTATGSELERVAVATGKTPSEVKNTMRETVNDRGDKWLEEDVPDTVENRIKGGILLERSASRSSQLRREGSASGRRTTSPRLNPSATFEAARSEKSSKSRSKISTPQLGTFADADTSESNAEHQTAYEMGLEASMKLKRPARPRMKDHHGLVDSLSPKGLPTKRMHKKNSSYSLTAVLNTKRDREDEPSVPDRKPTVRRTNSRSTKASDSVRESRNLTSTPKMAMTNLELVDEPETLASVTQEDSKPASSRRQLHDPRRTISTSNTLDLKPPVSTKSQSSTRAASDRSKVKAKSLTPLPNDQPLGSPGPEVDEADIDADTDSDDRAVPDVEVDADADVEPELEDEEEGEAEEDDEVEEEEEEVQGEIEEAEASPEASPSPVLQRALEPEPVSEAPPEMEIAERTPDMEREADVNMEMDIEIEDEDEDDPNEQRYCYCDGVSYGEMVACDNDTCEKEWFHLECTGLKSLPPARTTWFCEHCRVARARTGLVH